MPLILDPADSSPNLAEIERTSREFQQLASTIGDQLKAFEEWFNSLPGKTVAIVYRDASLDGEPAVCLKIDRFKDVWKLYFGSGADLNGDIEVGILDGASLLDKCRAVSMLPDLLQEFHNEQRVSVDRLKKAAGVFAQLPSGKGGK